MCYIYQHLFFPCVFIFHFGVILEVEELRKRFWGGGISNSVILREFLESREESVCIDEGRSSYSMYINSWEAVSFGM